MRDMRRNSGKFTIDSGELGPSRLLQESICKYDMQHRQHKLPPTPPRRKEQMTTASNQTAPPSPPARELSMLSTLIWMGQWEEVSQRLVVRPQEAKQKIQLPLFPNSSESIKAYPFHLACARRPLPPTSVMSDLVAAFPEACKLPTGTPLSLLPLHLVADLSNIGYNGDPTDSKMDRKHTSLPAKVPPSPNHAQVVTLLLHHFPESALLPESTNEMLPLHVAAATFKSSSATEPEERSVPVQVMELLVDAGPPQVATRLRDRSGQTPMDWAWRNAQYACPRCSKKGNEQDSRTTVSTASSQLSAVSYTCTCPEQQTGTKHPMLQSVIRSHLMTIQPAVRESDHEFVNPLMPSTRLKVPSQKVTKSLVLSEQTKPTIPPAITYSRREARDDTSWIKNVGTELDERKETEAGDISRSLARAKSFNEKRQSAPSPPTPVFPETVASQSTKKLQARSSPQSPTISNKFYQKVLESREIRSKLLSHQGKESEPEREPEIRATVAATYGKAIQNLEKTLASSQPENRFHDNKNAVLCLKLRLSDLTCPSRASGSSSSSGRVGSPPRRSFSNNINPNPCFEIFVAHRAGLSKGYYKSYPLYNVTEGTWEEAFVDMGLTRHQLRCGIDGAGHVEVGVRVMHCPNKGSDMKPIGITQISLEALERNAEQSINNFHNDDNNSNNRYPILQGYQVKGWLQVVSFRIK